MKNQSISPYNLTFPLTSHNLVYVKININKLIHKNHSLLNRERPRFLSKPLENYGLFWIKGWSTIEGQIYCEVSYEKIRAVPLVKGQKN